MNGIWLALVLGFAAGLRALTPVAAVLLVRGGIWGIVFAVAAAAEYVADLLPATPSRTKPIGVAARVVSGAFCGWMIAGTFGAIAGVAGALLGTYAGHAMRIAAMARIGAVPAAIAEDLIAISLAAFAVTR
jgi:uncharacterized membrane protein